MVSVLGDFLVCLLRKLDCVRTVLSDFPVHHLGACEGLVGIRSGWILALPQLSFCVLQGLKPAA